VWGAVDKSSFCDPALESETNVAGGRGVGGGGVGVS
jgi:hypothetical protein